MKGYRVAETEGCVASREVAKGWGQTRVNEVQTNTQIRPLGWTPTALNERRSSSHRARKQPPSTRDTCVHPLSTLPRVPPSDMLSTSHDLAGCAGCASVYAHDWQVRMFDNVPTVRSESLQRVREGERAVDKR